MTVYIVKRKGDHSGLMKIGFTRNIARRMKDMSVSNPEGFDVVRQYEGGRKLEADLHKAMVLNCMCNEWFTLNQEALDACDIIASVAKPDEEFTSPIPTPDDEYHENIVIETRFYLNELVKREWRGMGDTVEQARDRVMIRLGIPTTYGFRLWLKFKELNDVSGEAYRSLRLAYAHALMAENRINENQASFLKSIERAALLRAQNEKSA